MILVSKAVPFVCIIALTGVTGGLFAEASGGPVKIINTPIDQSWLVTLNGNARCEANAANDRGLVADDFHFKWERCCCN
jgi:hypothetical protein